MTQFPANIQFPIIVARSAADAIAAPLWRPAIAILPVHTDWNDFGYYFGATLLVMTAGGGAEQIGMRLMFEGRYRTEIAIDELLGGRPWLPLTEVNLRFCSVLDEVESYGVIIDLLGFEGAVSALRILGDAAVLQTERIDRRIELLESEEFAYGALRTEAAYVSYRRGAKYLRPQPIRAVEDAATNFVVTAHLPSSQNPYVVDFRFDNDALGRNRISVLIGKNGTGKTLCCSI
jgi:hypothetical protein